jgi:hypothetical protein
MIKNTVAIAVSFLAIAGFARDCSAVNLSPDDVGQVLLYPYYTVNGNNLTVLSVVNLTRRGKALKVRFLDARNARTLLHFNLYLSEYDVWTASVFSLSATGPANITTTDTSCTVPGIETGATGLSTLPDGQRYLPFRSEFNDYTQPALTDATRTRDGYIEIIEMGSINNDSDFGRKLTHQGNRPADCAALEAAWLADGLWTVTAGAADVDAPMGGLFGAAALVNVADGTFLNYNADAIDGFRSTAMHSPPDNDFPNLSSANSARAGVVTSYTFEGGRMVTSNWLTAEGRGVDAVSAVLMREAVVNEYAVDADLHAASEWVVTFPTRRYYVSALGDAIAPFTMRTANAPAGATGNDDCERASTRIYNREEDRFIIFNFFTTSPSLGPAHLCWAANPLWFQSVPQLTTSRSPITGAAGLQGTGAATVGPLWTGIPTYLQDFGIIQKRFQNGWFWIGFHDPDATINLVPAPLNRPPLVETSANAPLAPDRYFGLPAIGFWALRVENQNARPGVMAFYSGAYPHRSTRACYKGQFAASQLCD